MVWRVSDEPTQSELAQTELAKNKYAQIELDQE